MEQTGNDEQKKTRKRAPLNAVQKKAAQKATQRYIRDSYDRHVLNMPKGKKDLVKAAAEAAGESLNGYITKAVDERMERDSANK